MTLETLKRAANNLEIDVRSLLRQLDDTKLSDEDASYLNYALDEASNELFDIQREIRELSAMTPEELEELQ